MYYPPAFPFLSAFRAKICPVGGGMGMENETTVSGAAQGHVWAVLDTSHLYAESIRVPFC
jgi:hypothetical protein